ncbi:MAG: GNAT family N-acetyltransferase [Bradyrhizobium sp.]
MVATDRLAIVELGADDGPGGLALSREADWNQNEADWRFFLEAGTVFGIRDPDHRLIATAALLPYGSGNAWISMVLVTAPWRRRGLATRLVDACLAAAARDRLTPWLDATPAGAAVYGPLGFAPTLQLRRLRLQSSNRTAAGAPQLPAGNADDLAACDRRAMGFDRSALLAELCSRPNSLTWSSGNAIGLVRDGRTCRHTGPLFADHQDQALALVDGIIRNESGGVMIDVVSTQDTFLEGLTARGWSHERPFQRMRFGGAAADAVELPFAVAGPEYG